MPKLPVVSGLEAAKRFEKLGYQVVRQRGSHLRLLHPSNHSRQPLTIPNHTEIGRGLLRRLLRDSQISIQEFIDLAK